MKMFEFIVLQFSFVPHRGGQKAIYFLNIVCTYFRNYLSIKRYIHIYCKSRTINPTFSMKVPQFSPIFLWIFTLYMSSGFRQLNSNDRFLTPVRVFSVGLQFGADPTTEHTPHSGPAGSRLTTTVVLESTVMTIFRPSVGGKEQKARNKSFYIRHNASKAGCNIKGKKKRPPW